MCIEHEYGGKSKNKESVVTIMGEKMKKMELCILAVVLVADDDDIDAAAATAAAVLRTDAKKKKLTFLRQSRFVGAVPVHHVGIRADQ